MEKQEYIQPVIEKVTIDNEISVVLMSAPEGGNMGDPLQLPDIPGMS